MKRTFFSADEKQMKKKKKICDIFFVTMIYFV